MSESLLSSFGTINENSSTPSFVFPTLKTTAGSGTISSYGGLTVTVPSRAFCAFIYIGSDDSLMAFGDGVQVSGYNNSVYTARLTSTQLYVDGSSYTSVVASYFVLSLS